MLANNLEPLYPMPDFELMLKACGWTMTVDYIRAECDRNLNYITRPEVLKFATKHCAAIAAWAIQED